MPEITPSKGAWESRICWLEDEVTRLSLELDVLQNTMRRLVSTMGASTGINGTRILQ